MVRWSYKSRKLLAGLAAAFVVDWTPPLAFSLLLREDSSEWTYVCSPRELSALALLRAFAGFLAVGVSSLRGFMRTLAFAIQTIATGVILAKIALITNALLFHTHSTCASMQRLLSAYSTLELAVGWLEVVLLDLLHQQRLRDQGSMLAPLNDPSSSALDEKFVRIWVSPQNTPFLREEDGHQFATPPEYGSQSSSESERLLEESERDLARTRSETDHPAGS